jgi:predicted nucleotidyltransferase
MIERPDNDIRAIIQANKHVIYSRFHVESLSLFGSFSKGEAKVDSDVDILVRYKKTPGIFSFLDLKNYLESILNKPVDLVTEGALKKEMRREILQEAIRVA